MSETDFDETDLYLEPYSDDPTRPGAGRLSSAAAEHPLDAVLSAPAPQGLQTMAAAAAAPSGRTTADGMDLDQILLDRPDVFRAFFTEFYGSGNDRHSGVWEQRVGGASPQDYANYWYERHGKWEGYSQAGKTAHEAIDIDRLLRDRPDVFQGFFTEYYGPHNDRHSSAWKNRVGGETVEDYARYWYDTYGKQEGYTQRAASGGGAAAPEPAEPPEEPAHEDDPGYRLEDPSLDPWNHPALYPDAKPPAPVEPAPDPTAVGQSLTDPDPFG